jgi:hypothetical protein
MLKLKHSLLVVLLMCDPASEIRLRAMLLARRHPKKGSLCLDSPGGVGTNTIFIYLVFETVGHQWLKKAEAIFVPWKLALHW